MKQKLTLNGLTPMNALNILVAIVMASVCLYLTIHYFEVRFPSSIGGGSSLCDLSSFFNCDAATHSSVSNLFGIPISFFGMITSLVFLFSTFLPSEEQEKTCSALSKYNFIGCVVLFFYSLIVLGSLCPFCSLYYVLSGVMFWLYWKKGINSWLPTLKPTALWLGIFLLLNAFMYNHVQNRSKKSSSLNQQTVTQFKALENIGDPDIDSSFRIFSSTTNFKDAPIRVSIFSDFQCPFCKIVANQMHALERQFVGKINIQYFFYPLDNACNPNVKKGFHQFACHAAMLAACVPDNFKEVHDAIFANQESLSFPMLNSLAEQFSASKCLEEQASKDQVMDLINQGSKYNLRSTPTLIINGRKIEGSITNTQFSAIFKELLKK